VQLFSATKIDFMGARRVTTILSVAAVLFCLGDLVLNQIRTGSPLELGIDFTGGVLLEVGYSGTADLEAIRQVLKDSDFDDVLVQNFGSSQEVLIRLPPQGDADSSAIRDAVIKALQSQDSSVTLRRIEFVGPQVGKELTEQGGLAMLFALIMIFGYVVLRFQWKFAVGAIAALVHDVILTIGFFGLLGLTFDLTVLAAVLATIGYSLNDTIVVFDRIRENFRAIRKTTPEEILNISINQMLARTLITGVTTLLVLVALLVFGGETVAGFAIALIVGLIVGTYSSIYVASAAALLLRVSSVDLMPPKKTAEIDDLP
jgi:preprotein translocase subunit SecF